MASRLSVDLQPLDMIHEENEYLTVSEKALKLQEKIENGKNIINQINARDIKELKALKLPPPAI
jgi:hypothetical protein